MARFAESRDSGPTSTTVSTRSVFIRRLRRGLPITGLAMATTVALVAFAGASGGQVGPLAQPPVGLGTADSFAVLAGQQVTNTGTSVISGDVGVSPGSAVNGFPPGVVVNGTIHAADSVAAQAQLDLTTAYNDAAGRTPASDVGGAIGSGQTLPPGVYNASSALLLNGSLTLDAQGDPNAVFIFQTGSTLISGSGSTVALIGAAQACNVYWQVGSSATLGTTTTFVGTVMALTSASLDTGATVEGRILARNGSVTLDDNTITNVGCAVQPTTTPPTSPTSTGPTSTSTGPTSPGNTSPGHGAGGQSSHQGNNKPPKGHPETGDGGSYRAGGGALIPIGVLALVGAAVAGRIAIRRRRDILAGLRDE